MNKTTSTDMEELKKEFELLFTIDGLFEDDLRGHRLLHTNNSKRIWDFFAPHLSNKSELKKEAVIEAIDKMDKEMTCVYGSCEPNCSHVSFARAKLRQLKQYLSSNEKEGSEGK